MSICLTVYFYVQDLFYVDVNMVTEFQQLWNFTNKCKKVQTSEFILSKNHSKNNLFRKKLSVLL